MPLINFQCPDALHKDFASTAKRLHYSQSEVLRTLVSSFVSRNRHVQEDTLDAILIRVPGKPKQDVEDIHIDDLLGGEK